MMSESRAAAPGSLKRSRSEIDGEEVNSQAPNGMENEKDDGTRVCSGTQDLGSSGC